MKAGNIILIFVILALIGGVVLLYFKVEKPAEIQASNSSVNLSIYAQVDGKNIITNYNVFVNGSLYSNGTTLRDGLVLEVVPSNSEITVYNVNLGNQIYYIEEYDKFLTTTESQRVLFNLEEPGKLNITQTGLLNGSEIILNISSYNGSYKELQFCIRWGIHIITVRTNANVISNPEKYNDYVHCYTTNIDLNEGNSYLINLNYPFFGELDPRDNIDLVFFGNECNNNYCDTNNQTYVRTETRYNIKY
jgi:hypothetical protein